MLNVFVLSDDVNATKQLVFQANADVLSVANEPAHWSSDNPGYTISDVNADFGAFWAIDFAHENDDVSGNWTLDTPADIVFVDGGTLDTYTWPSPLTGTANTPQQARASFGDESFDLSLFTAVALTADVVGKCHLNSAPGPAPNVIGATINMDGSIVTILTDGPLNDAVVSLVFDDGAAITFDNGKPILTAFPFRLAIN